MINELIIGCFLLSKISLEKLVNYLEYPGLR